jgi:uncharacterized protein (TIRG00374 family)
LRWSRLLRLAVAVSLTAFVIYKAHPSEILWATAGADLRWIAAAVALVLADRTLMALRWMDLLGALTAGTRPRLPLVLEIFFVSSFVSNFVPSVAADMYRAYALARHDVRLSESTASVLMDRMLGVLSMVIVGICALPVARDLSIQRGLIAGLLLAFAGCAAGAVIVFSERAAGVVMRIAAQVPWAALQRIAAALTEAVRKYAHHQTALVRVLMMSVLVQGIRVLQAWCLGEALGLDLPLSVYFALLPVILLIMQLPITINGLGTTQAAFAGFFGAAGGPEPQVVALSVLFLVLGIVGSLPGGLIYALRPARELPGAHAS